MGFYIPICLSYLLSDTPTHCFNDLFRWTFVSQLVPLILHPHLLLMCIFSEQARTSHIVLDIIPPNVSLTYALPSSSLDLHFCILLEPINSSLHSSCPNNLNAQLTGSWLGCVVLFVGELHRCTELLFYSPLDITETVVKFISLSPVTHRFNQAQPSGVLKKVNKVTHPPSAWQTTDAFFHWNNCKCVILSNFCWRKRQIFVVR